MRVSHTSVFAERLQSIKRPMEWWNDRASDIFVHYNNLMCNSQVKNALIHVRLHLPWFVKTSLRLLLIGAFQSLLFRRRSALVPIMLHSLFPFSFLFFLLLFHVILSCLRVKKLYFGVLAWKPLIFLSISLTNKSDRYNYMTYKYNMAYM